MEVLKVTGLKELQANLKLLSTEMGTTVLAIGSRDAARVFQNYAISKAPMHPWPHKVKRKGGGYDTVQPGNLRRNIVVRKVKVAGGALYAVVVRASAWYGKFLEFGTSKMSAKPFMRPAFDENTQKAIDAFIASTRRGVDKVARKFKIPMSTTS